MAFTIEWLLRQNLGEGFSLLAGGLDELIPITGVNIMDNPDTLPWLYQGTLVLSTGYLFEVGKLDQNIIRNLKGRGCSGLGIKMHRYLKELPQNILEPAQEYRFPIINVPFSASLGEISNMVYRKIYEEEMTEAQRIGLLYHEISENILVHQNLSRSIEIIQEATKSDIFLTNDSFEIMEYSLSPYSDWEFPFAFSKNSYTLFSETDLTKLRQLLQGSQLPVYTHIVSGLEFHIYPLINRESILGHLIILKTNITSASALELLLNLRSTFCLSLLNKVMLTESERSNRDIFFHNLLSGTLQKEQEIERLCIQNNFPYGEYRICLAIKIPEYEQMSLSKRRAYERSLFSMTDRLNTILKATVIHTIFQTFIVLFYFPAEELSQTAYIRSGSDYAQRLSNLLNTNHIQHFIGLSKCSRGALSIHDNYMQAVNELQIGHRLHPKEIILSYYEDEIKQLLIEHFSTRQLRAFAQETLGPLEKYDSHNQTELLTTLKMYISTNNNMTQTAKDLFIHRNTCSYRLDQIQHILSMDLNNPDTIFRLKAALIISDLQELL
ncbi:MAG: PucR family transcriptional regulator [Lachnospiraceae bacterium]|nr:PucR family transcriptional regulator [Lachnospiraceae bacterium]